MALPPPPGVSKSENSDLVVVDLQKLKDVLQNDSKYYILENIKGVDKGGGGGWGLKPPQVFMNL